MKKWWKHSKNSIMRGVLTVACAMLFFVSQKSVCFAEATAKVKAPTAYIRTTPDKNSEPVGSTSSGKTITIISQTTDSSGYVWYEVHVEDNKTGYIRSDLVDVDSSSGTIPTSSSAAPAQSSEQPAATASGAEILPETGMDAQYATVKVATANVRSAAAKNKAIVGKVTENTQVIVTGQTEGPDKTWYYITFTGANGEEKTGYVRSDMITLGEMVPVEEPQEAEPQEEPETQDTEPEVTVHQDYELKYELDEQSGENVWKLYDYTQSTEYAYARNVKDVLAAISAKEANSELDAKTVSKQRIVIIVLIAVIIILAVVMTIMIFKLRDAYYEEYEDDEDEEDEEDRRKKERRREAEETKRSEGRSSSGKSDGRSERNEKGERRREREEREEPVRRKSSQTREERQSAPRKKSAETDRRMPEREVSYEEEAAEPVKSAPKKKAKNFMIDDDDFEFEFLNTKNKDKDL